MLTYPFIHLVKTDDGEPAMLFTPDDVMNEWQPEGKGKKWRKTGDSTVPFEGAVPPFLSEKNLVHRLLIRFLTNSQDKYKNTWGRHVPNIATADWKPAISDLQSRN